jgi:hypothetical protein
MLKLVKPDLSARNVVEFPMDPVQALQEAARVSHDQLAAAYAAVKASPKLYEFLGSSFEQAANALGVLENTAIVAAFRTGRLEFRDPGEPPST